MGEKSTTQPTEADKRRLKRTRNVLVGSLLSVGAIGGAQQKPLPNPEPVVSQPAKQTTTTSQAMGPAELEPSMNPAVWLPEKVRSLWPSIEAEASKHGVDPKLVAIFVAEESGGDHKAYNSSGATGLMQIMPVTSQFVAEKRGITNYDMTNAEQNLDFGSWYLSYLHNHYAQPNNLDTNSYVGRSIYYVGMSGGVGDLTRFIKSGYDMRGQSKQTQQVSQLWEQMYQDWDRSHSEMFEKLRGGQR